MVPQIIATPQVVPFETLAASESRSGVSLLEGAETPLDVTGLPSPAWTEVAIDGQASGTQPSPSATPPPSEGRAVAASPVSSAPTSVVQTPTPVPSPPPTGGISGLFNTISERTAQWPILWPWVLLIVVVVVVGIIWLIRRANRNNYNNPL
jgi:hypothetical protein